MVLIFHWVRLNQSLILFFLLTGCAGKEEISAISFRWKDDQPVAIEVPRRYLSDIRDDSIGDYLTIHLSDGTARPAILGSYNREGNSLVFEPLLPFTRGLSYDVRMSGESLAILTVPPLEHHDSPELLGIFPTQDTLPQNLLKVYLQFSIPMQEGQALSSTVLLRNGNDTVSSVFLNLKPELWNYDRTILTLWLDPGRIKRDLQPNKRLGSPLEITTDYRLVVGSGWRDVHGDTLARNYFKDFHVTHRDSLSPDPKQWEIHKADAGTRDPLIINFNESLDAVLLREVLRVAGPDGNIIAGDIELEEEESVCIFTPASAWAKGKYRLQSEARLEDLAGNNLNRPFDRDITRDAQPHSEEFFVREFRVD